MSRLERLFLNLATFSTAGSGLLYAWMKYLMKNDDPFSVVNHPWQPTLLSIHVLAAPLLLFGFGFIAREHFISKYRDTRARKGRRMGVLAVLNLLPMVFSGYLLQVVTNPTARPMVGWFHLASGVLFLITYGTHLFFAAKSARPRAKRPPGRAKPLLAVKREAQE